jgi:uncharacterized protein YkwD
VSRSAIVVLAVVAASITGSAARASATPKPAAKAVVTPALDAEESSFCRAINSYRVQQGLVPLQVSIAMINAAKWDTTDMAQKNYFSHTDSVGRDPFKRMAAFGYTFQTAEGENIAAGNATASATLAQWKASAPHNQNMLNAGYKVIGISRSYSAGATYGWYWTTDFGGYTDKSVPCPTS